MKVDLLPLLPVDAATAKEEPEGDATAISIEV